MNILEEIISHKQQEVREKKELYPVKLLEKSLYFSSPTISLTQYLKRDDKFGIIAEIKRASPSRGILNPSINVEDLSIGYMQAGASALSVLTETKYFKGSNEDLTTARKFNYCPILRKDFIFDEYQLIEARSIGADAVLLIAAALSQETTRTLAAFARSLGLQVLLEIHDATELSHICEAIDIVGVNNRNLATLEIDLRASHNLADQIPSNFLKISESGISDAATINQLRSLGYQGFLIGESFMKESQPQRACKKLIESLNAK